MIEISQNLHSTYSSLTVLPLVYHIMLIVSLVEKRVPSKIWGSKISFNRDFYQSPKKKVFVQTQISLNHDFH